jgi:hypothetical protein
MASVIPQELFSSRKVMLFVTWSRRGAGGGATQSVTEPLNEMPKFMQRADLMDRRGRWRNAGPEDLDRGHFKLIACGNFRIWIVANHEDLFWRKLMVPKDRLERMELAFRP